MNKESLPPVAVAGNIVLDIFPPLILPKGQNFTDLLIGGQVISTGQVVTSTGGCVPNTGISLHKSGIPIYLMGRISDDLLGREIQRKLKRQGIDSSHINIVEGGSSYTVVLAPPDTDRIFLHYSGPNDDFSLDDIHWDIIEKVGIFHLGYPSLLPTLYTDRGKTLADLFKKAKELGTTTSMDMSMVSRGSHGDQQDWVSILKRVLPHVDLLLPSVVEMLFFIRRDLFDQLSIEAGKGPVVSVVNANHMMELSKTLLDMGAGLIALKSGPKGLYIRTADINRMADFGRVAPANLGNWVERELWEPGFKPSQIVSATGAGDAAVAGFLAALVYGCSIESALRYACALGVENLEAMDATSSIRSWEETTQLMKTELERNDLPINHKDWKYDHENGLWIGPSDQTRL